MAYFNNLKSKYNVDISTKGKTSRTYDGIIFDSKLECRFYKEFILPGIKIGKIKDFKRQVRYILQPKFLYKDKKIRAIEYISDFDITYSDGSFVVVDVKGMVKPMDILKSKMFKFNYPNIDFEFMGYSKIDGGFIQLDIISENRKKRSKEGCKK